MSVKTVSIASTLFFLAGVAVCYYVIKPSETEWKIDNNYLESQHSKLVTEHQKLMLSSAAEHDELMRFRARERAEHYASERSKTFVDVQCDAGSGAPFLGSDSGKIVYKGYYPSDKGKYLLNRQSQYEDGYRFYSVEFKKSCSHNAVVVLCKELATPLKPPKIEKTDEGYAISIDPKQQCTADAQDYNEDFRRPQGLIITKRAAQAKP